MANHPKFNGGSMDIAAGEKTIRLIELCDTFHLPLVYFADEPGFSVGRAKKSSATFAPALASSPRSRRARPLRLLRSAPAVRRLPVACTSAARASTGAIAGRLRTAAPCTSRAAPPSPTSATSKTRRTQKPNDRDRGSLAGDLVAVSQCPRLRHRGDHRSARHPPAAGGFHQGRAASNRHAAGGPATGRAIAPSGGVNVPVGFPTFLAQQVHGCRHAGDAKQHAHHHDLIAHRDQRFHARENLPVIMPGRFTKPTANTS